MKTSNFEFLKPRWEAMAHVASSVMEEVAHLNVSTAIWNRVTILNCDLEI